MRIIFGSIVFGAVLWEGRQHAFSVQRMIVVNA